MNLTNSRIWDFFTNSPQGPKTPLPKVSLLQVALAPAPEA